MRVALLAAVAAAGLAFASVPPASAAPAYGAGAATAAAGVELTQDVRWWRHRHHCWWRHGRRVCGW